MSDSIKQENEAIVNACDDDADGYESGTEEEQQEFKQELEVFHVSRGLIFKPPRFYQEEVNLLKLYRLVIKHGGYEQVTSSKLWRQIGEYFNPPKTCTMLAYSFRVFYEKALLMEYEKHKILSSDDTNSFKSPKSPISPDFGRPPRNSAIRAKKVWQSLRASSTSSNKGDREIEELPKKGDVDDMHVPINEPIEDEGVAQEVGFKTIYTNPKFELKVNVNTSEDGVEIYALVPGLSREEIRVQYSPDGQYFIIRGQPKDMDNNPWGVAPFEEVVKLGVGINPHQTNAVVTLHGQLFIRAPLE